MSPTDPSLDLLRTEIDSIDIAIHDLIVKRGTIVEDIRKIKNGAGPALRPGREATILRGLAERHRGRFPLPALISLWREMMGGFTHMQEPVTVAVHGAPGSDRLLRLARDHYGAITAITTHPTASACVGAVAEGRVQVAVLPLPADGEAESWWRLLMSNDEKTPHVVARLPFVSKDGGDQALVVASWERDVSAIEASLIALRFSERASRSRIMAAVAAAGFGDAVSYATVEADPDDCFHVIEVAGELARTDPRIAALSAQFGGALTEAYVIGGYARQLALPDASDRN